MRLDVSPDEIRFAVIDMNFIGQMVSGKLSVVITGKCRFVAAGFIPAQKH